MNHALDALWWRLNDQAVRDLAALLTAPAPWPTGVELTLPELLGEHGFRVLLALDAQPAPLHAWLAASAGHRLGHYAERLLAYWLTHAPHSELIAANLAVIDDGRTSGEYDFLARLNSEPLHIELACKYYFQAGDDLDSLLGPNRQEHWRDKQQRLIGQLALAQTEAGQRALSAGFTPQRSVSVLRGNLFYRDQPWLKAPLSVGQWSGWWRHTDEEWPAQREDSRWLLLPRRQWLSPGRAVDSVFDQTGLRAQLTGDVVQMVAECESRSGGVWHEIARGLVVPV